MESRGLSGLAWPSRVCREFFGKTPLPRPLPPCPPTTPRLAACSFRARPRPPPAGTGTGIPAARGWGQGVKPPGVPTEGSFPPRVAFGGQISLTPNHQRGWRRWRIAPRSWKRRIWWAGDSVSLPGLVIRRRTHPPARREGGERLSAVPGRWNALAVWGDARQGAGGAWAPVHGAIGSRFPSPLPGR